MNAVVVALDVAGAEARVEAWRRSLTVSDRLFVLTLERPPREPEERLGLWLDRDRGRWGRRLIGRLIPRFPTIAAWGGYAPLRWRDDDLVDNLRWCDPDVVDLGALPGAEPLHGTLAGRLGGARSIGPSEPPEPHPDDGAWRRHGPERTVSIVLPVHDGARYLAESIDSCLAQTHRRLELVIVDDASTDASAAIATEYAARDPRVRLLRNRRNLGLPGSLNRGFAACRGELLSWTSDDNRYHPEAIETLVSYLCTWPEVDLVCAAYRRIDADGERLPGTVRLPPPWRLGDDNTVGACFLYRRALYATIGGYREDLACIEDYEYWVRAHVRGFTLVPLHAELYDYRLHPDSLTERSRDRWRELRARVRAEHGGRIRRG